MTIREYLYKRHMRFAALGLAPLLLGFVVVAYLQSSGVIQDAFNARAIGLFFLGGAVWSYLARVLLGGDRAIACPKCGYSFTAWGTKSLKGPVGVQMSYCPQCRVSLDDAHV